MRNQSLTANHFNKINDYKVCLFEKKGKESCNLQNTPKKYNIIFLISSL